MKKYILIVLAMFLLVVPTNAKKPQLSNSLWFVMEKQQDLCKQPNDSIICNIGLYNILKYYNGQFIYIPYLLIIIRNESERTIYIDKQNSFIIPNGQSYPIYQNETRVTTQGNTSTTGVNLGLVGVGSASSDYNTKIIQEERFLIIPAGTKKDIKIPFVEPWGKPWSLQTSNGGYIGLLPEVLRSSAIKDVPPVFVYQRFINEGELLSYEGENNPFCLDFRITYSFDESMKPNFVNKSVYYTKYVIGSSFNHNPFKKGYETDANMANQLLPELKEYQMDLAHYMVVRLLTWKALQKGLKR